MIRTYQELIVLPTFDERLEYLFLNGQPGSATFGSHRHLNQTLYHSYEWQKFRREIVVRDKGCDLAHPDYPINKGLYIHHLNPITIENILNRDLCVFDPNNVVCVSFDTHQMIHYGNMDIVKSRRPADRTPNDTVPWR